MPLKKKRHNPVTRGQHGRRSNYGFRVGGLCRYEALIGSEFERMHGWHVNPSMLASQPPASFIK